jgi:hypothetical protein
VFDGHNDLPGEIRGKGFQAYDIAQRLDPRPHGHPALARGRRRRAVLVGLRAGLRDAHATAARYCREQIELIRAMCARYPAISSSR